ncbi:MAG: hypothetical protein ACRDM7_22760 [Thermoleophilaceae bacterium]
MIGSIALAEIQRSDLLDDELEVTVWLKDGTLYRGRGDTFGYCEDASKLVRGVVLTANDARVIVAESEICSIEIYEVDE